METENLNQDEQLQSEENTVEQKTDEQVILDYLKEEGSPKLQERLQMENGESYCVSYILRNVQDGHSVPVALGWLEQELEN